jgi:hypothetical protein
MDSKKKSARGSDHVEELLSKKNKAIITETHVDNVSSYFRPSFLTYVLAFSI